MEAGAATQTHTQMLLDYAEACGREPAICLAERTPQTGLEYNGWLTRVEPEDLTRFEGEGGLEAPAGRFSKGEATKDGAHREVAGHLSAFAKQFSIDNKSP
jgi:hypothetical protein